VQYSATKFLIVKIDQIFEKMDERMRSWRGNAHLHVERPICDVLYKNLIITRLSAAVLSRVVIRLIFSE